MHADHTPASALSRRRFLTGSAAAVALVAAGCSDGGSSGTSTGASSTTATSAGAGAQSTTTVHTARLAADPFTLGVASGDPLADRVILWTRLAPDALAVDGSGGMAGDPVDVVWEIATDDRFTKVVTSGVFTAEVDHGHSVHVDATGLDPGTDHHYRFRVGDWTSPVGRARTLPDGTPDRFALAVANCQMLETGAFAAYRHLATQDLDLVLHLGDYIYEYPGVPGPRMSQPGHAVVTLADYRLRYASYHLDTDLQAAHARFPFVVTWDDHEVANNYMGDVVPGSPSGGDLDRKAAAYQAWWENLPVRLDPPQGSVLAVHRSFQVGDLARVHVLDERQHSDLPPCRPDPRDTTDFGNCEAREAEDRSRLGADQEAWLQAGLAEGGVTWNLLGNPVVLAGIDSGAVDGEAAYYLDVWDGFPQARDRLLGQLAGADNPVVLTGDYHQGMVLDVHRTPFDTGSEVVAPEFMAPPISSVLFSQDVGPRTPHLREQLDRHGYLAVEVTPDQLTARFQVVADVADAASPVTTASTWVVDAGDPVTRRA
ncbi:MAG TPA: alkaline phosphatase D family protein [Acidimicrobiales bacterium]|nr:alkaline phosphatase D family protein [Acidimicrobiales bacterium]